MRESFQAHVQEFTDLRDMILSEPRARVVGQDFVAGLDSEHGSPCAFELSRQEGEQHWKAEYPPGPDVMATFEDVMGCVGLSADRYAQYLELLGGAGGTRISRFEESGTASVHSVEVKMYDVFNGESMRIKSIVFFPGAPPDDVIVAKTTDNMPDHTVWYCPLVDGWYMKHMRR